MAEFDFDLPDGAVDKDLYKNDRAMFPGVVWHGKVSAGEAGYWSMNVDPIKSLLDTSDEPASPKPFWEMEEVRFGSDPNADPVLCWTTKRLRCVPVGTRKRIIIKDDLKVEHFYPWMTPRDRRIEGKYSSHYQVMVFIPGLVEPVVLGLKGMTKCVSWSNDSGGKFGKADFPRGVEQRITDYSNLASEQKKTVIPELCFWEIDLVPVHVSGKPHFVNVGHGTWMNPFGIDLRTGMDGMPDSRFVGIDRLLQYQEYRKNAVLDWEAEWADAANLTEKSGKQSDSYGDVPDTQIENDEIPF